MTPNEARFSHIANIFVGGTGLIWLWMRYLLEPEDEFALINHPWEPMTEKIHLITAPLLVFAIGIIWRTHVINKIEQRSSLRRKSGSILCGLFFPMTISAYCLQTAQDEFARNFWLVTHLATGVLWIGFYLGHQLLKKA